MCFGPGRCGTRLDELDVKRPSPHNDDLTDRLRPSVSLWVISRPLPSKIIGLIILFIVFGLGLQAQQMHCDLPWTG